MGNTIISVIGLDSLISLRREKKNIPIPIPLNNHMTNVCLSQNSVLHRDLLFYTRLSTLEHITLLRNEPDNIFKYFYCPTLPNFIDRVSKADPDQRPTLLKYGLIVLGFHFLSTQIRLNQNSKWDNMGFKSRIIARRCTKYFRKTIKVGSCFCLVPCIDLLTQQLE